MRFIFLWMTLMGTALGAIRSEGEFILPFERKSYPLKDFIKDYAEALGVNISYAVDLMGKDQSVIDLYIHQKTSFSHFTALFKSILDSRGYTLIMEDGFQWITQARNTKYHPSEFYPKGNYPNDEGYITTLVQIKYPIAAEVSRNLRPFLSHYGRVISFGDGRSIVLHEKGDNARRLKEAINFMDTERSYRTILDRKPQETAPEDDPKEAKIIELELKNKILENKVTQETKREKP